jgi:hypothetical protein
MDILKHLIFIYHESDIFLYLLSIGADPNLKDITGSDTFQIANIIKGKYYIEILNNYNKSKELIRINNQIISIFIQNDLKLK